MKIRVRVWFELSFLDRLRVLFGAPVNHTITVDGDTGAVIEDMTWVGKPHEKSIRRLPIGTEQ